MVGNLPSHFCDRLQTVDNDDLAREYQPYI